MSDARETIERLRELECMAGPNRDHGVPVFWPELRVLLDVAEAAERLRAEWAAADDAFQYFDGNCAYRCAGCGSDRACRDDCPAGALDRALDALGEVG